MKWRYEESTKTIRAVPSNHWIASMDSWDGAEDHEANARLIASAPELLEALRSIGEKWSLKIGDADLFQVIARVAIRKAKET